MTDYKLTLASRDLYLVRIENQIKEKQEFLQNKCHEIKQLEIDNEYLRSIRDDYQEYNNYVLSQKKQQVTVMQYLNNYLDNIVENSELTDEDINKARIDQRKIMNEIQYIKDSIDNLITFKDT